MKRDIQTRIDEFAKNHLLLSSYLCLLFISTFLEFFRIYAMTAGYYSLDGGVENIIYAATGAVPVFWVIPVFFISLFLYSFLKYKRSQNARSSLMQKFILTFFPTLAVLLLFSIWIIQETLLFYPKTPLHLYPLGIFTSCLYSIVFSMFIVWLSEASGVRLIVQSTIVSLLMGFFYFFLSSLSRWSI